MSDDRPRGGQEPQWEMVLDAGDNGDTMRLRIRHGWLYRQRELIWREEYRDGVERDELKAMACALVFVPDTGGS